MTLKEAKEQQKNGYNVVSLFSGCGGNSLGYLFSGYTLKLAVEFDKEARDAYSLNFSTTPVLFKDIRQINGKEILDAIGLKKYELDILDGSPPCASFSTAGAREKYWGKEKEYSGTRQRTDDLFFEYLRIVNEIKPKVFVAENVKGLSLGKARKYLDSIIKKAESIGYNTEVKLMDSSLYGVPQKRERLIFIGVRKDIGIMPSYPIATGEIITTKEAIGDLIHDGTDGTPLTPERMAKVKELGPECSVKDIQKFEETHGKQYRSYYVRDYWNKPCYTILTREPFIHPLVDRKLSTREGLRLQSFPDDFLLPNVSFGQNWERIGRAAPPKLLQAVSKNIELNVLNKVTATPETAERFFAGWKDDFEPDI